MNIEHIFLIVFAGLVFLLWRQQKTIDLCLWRAFLLKGLNPAVENPEAFGPKAMADAHVKLADATVPSFEREEYKIQQAQNEEWERQAEEYRLQEEMAKRQHSEQAEAVLRLLAKQKQGE